jgi:sialate O-acetylesterase
MADYKARLKKIEESGDRLPIYQKDPGNRGYGRDWAINDFDDNSWEQFDTPGYWENRGDMQIDGAVWFRKEIEIPETWSGKELILTLGAIDDFDTAYFNGIQIGATGEETPQFWLHQREYIIPAKQVRPGRAVIAVRIFDHYGQGGFGGPGSKMRLGLKSNTGLQPIKLAGVWKMKVEKAMDPSAISGPGGQGLPQEPQGPGHPYSPGGLYHAMIYPLKPYAIKGAIWYQGEANADRAYQYRTLLPAMIRDWRKLWSQGNFPFGIVQLANYMSVSEEPQESSWAELREAQLFTALNDPETGLATIIDIGEADDIHPRNKQDVGRRLALWALAETYGKDVEFSGPLYKSMTVRDGKAILHFTHVADGLVAAGNGELKGFDIAGKDKLFHRAEATIEKDRIVVWSEAVEDPVAVRYAWADNPVCNLYNSEMLPAVPFRTDDWPGVTFQMR